MRKAIGLIPALCLERAPLQEAGFDLATAGGTSGGIGRRTGKPPPRFGVG